MASEYLRPYVFPRTMDLWRNDDLREEEHTSCCGACASLGTSDSTTTDIFRYSPRERLVIRARRGAASEDYPVTKAVVVVGRATARADLVIRDPIISRVQCRFVFAHGDVEVEDMGSACGTIVNGRMVARAKLREGDVVFVGDSKLEVVRV